VKLDRGQVAVITGAASGIGLALAQDLARRGLRLMLADVEVAALEAARLQFADNGFDVAAEVVDVADPAACERLVAATVARFCQVDLLVNNAGVGGVIGPIWTSDPREWNWTLGVNLFGVVHGLQAFLPHMLARGQGHVVNIASMAGLTTSPFLSAYSASKHAVVALSESLAGELAATAANIKVSVACPSMVLTRIFESERNRPEHLRSVSRTPPEILRRFREDARAGVMNNLIDAADAASRIVAGVERDDFYILTHGDYDAVLTRLSVVENAVATSRALHSTTV
jgi:short-subunit dehydrogenase